MKKLTAIDLFCGCGGLTEGLKQAGFNVTLAVDNAEKPLQTYKLNHPEVSIFHDDICKLSESYMIKKMEFKKNELDLLAGCPPCQGFSSMRTKNGKYSTKDDRNSLINEFLRIALILQPKVVMLENVPELKKDSLFLEFISKMETIGYLGKWTILNAKNFGVPQSRKRLIYIATRKGEIEILSNMKLFFNIRRAIGCLPKSGSSGDFLHDFQEKRTPHIKEMISLIPKDGGSRSDLPEKYVLPCHKRNPRGFKDVYGRMAWNDPSPTITGGCASPSKGRFLHPEENRCITLREAAILQGFPSNYQFDYSTSRDALALMIGNALPPPFICHHAKQIKEHLEKERYDG